MVKLAGFMGYTGYLILWLPLGNAKIVTTSNMSQYPITVMWLWDRHWPSLICLSTPSVAYNCHWVNYSFILMHVVVIQGGYVIVLKGKSVTSAKWSQKAICHNIKVSLYQISSVKLFLTAIRRSKHGFFFQLIFFNSSRESQISHSYIWKNVHIVSKGCSCQMRPQRPYGGQKGQ